MGRLKGLGKGFDRYSIIVLVLYDFFTTILYSICVTQPFNTPLNGSRNINDHTAVYRRPSALD